MKTSNRVLLCEKNGYFRNALLKIIRSRFPDMETKWVETQHECLEAAGAFDPAVLILGINIYGDNDKLDLLGDLRGKYPGLKIILFTDYAIEEYGKEAIQRGADHIIAKDSWSADEILSFLGIIFGKSAGQPAK